MELPVSLEAEQAFLGAVMNKPILMDDVVDYLEPNHFANAGHGEVYAFFKECFANNAEINLLKVQEKFKNNPEFKEVGGGAYLSKLYASVIKLKGAEGYARMVHDNAIRRQVIELGQTLVNQSYDTSLKSGSEIIAEFEKEIHALYTPTQNGEELKHIAESNKQALESVLDAIEHGGEVVGVPTGLKALDVATGGFSGGQLLVLAGRPGMGKTCLSLGIAKGAAEAGYNTAFFSLEMQCKELSLRLASDLCYEGNDNVPYFKAINGDLTQAEFNHFQLGMSKADQLPIYITDKGGVTVHSVRAEMRRLRRYLQKEGKTLDFVVIDYLQLMRSSSHYRGNKVQEVSEITAALKVLAKEFDIPILLLSQLNRGLEQREDKRPLLSDLRDSGSIEQDADAVFFVYREYEYIKNNEPKKNVVEWMAECDYQKNKLDLIIAKQRRGPTKTLMFDCHLHSNAVRDLT